MAARLYCPLPLQTGVELSLPAQAARHVQVLRLQPGDGITLFHGGADGSGGEFKATVATANGEQTFDIGSVVLATGWVPLAEKYLRISGKTVEELAEEVGTSRSTMYYKLNGGSDMSVEMAIKVKAALGAEESIEKLFARSDEPEKQEGEAHDAET